MKVFCFHVYSFRLNPVCVHSQEPLFHPSVFVLREFFILEFKLVCPMEIYSLLICSVRINGMEFNIYNCIQLCIKSFSHVSRCTNIFQWCIIKSKSISSVAGKHPGKSLIPGDHESLYKFQSQSMIQYLLDHVTVWQNHLGSFSRASLSHHQHHPVFSDELDNFPLAFMYRQGASKAVQF